MVKEIVGVGDREIGIVIDCGWSLKAENGVVGDSREWGVG